MSHDANAYSVLDMPKRATGVVAWDFTHCIRGRLVEMRSCWSSLVTSQPFSVTGDGVEKQPPCMFFLQRVAAVLHDVRRYWVIVGRLPDRLSFERLFELLLNG